MAQNKPKQTQEGSREVVDMKLEFMEYSDEDQGVIQVNLVDGDLIIGKLEGVDLDSVDFQVDYETLDVGKYKFILFVGDITAETMNRITDFTLNASYTELLLRLRQYLESNMTNYSENIISEYEQLTKPVTICSKAGDIFEINRKDGTDFRVYIYDEYADIVMAKGYSRRIDGKYSIADIKEMIDSEIEER